MKPYAKAQTIPLHGLADRRRVLTDAQKQEIREIYAKGGIGTRPLAARYHCSRSLIRLIVNPEAAARCANRFKAHWREYAQKYGKAYHAASVRNTRNYKYRRLKENISDTPLDKPEENMI